MTFDDQFDCFVISLKRQPERLQGFLGRNAASEIHFRHFDAIDGAQSNSVANWTPGAVGNAMSHHALWRRCAEQRKSLVVFEDDATVRHDLKARLTSLVAEVDGWDIILLGYNTDAPLEMRFAPGIDFGAVFSVRFPTEQHLADFANATNPVNLQRLLIAFGTCGYAVTSKGAELLIRSCSPLDSRPVHCGLLSHVFSAQALDCIMATIYPSLCAYACLPPLVMTANDPKTSTTIADPGYDSSAPFRQFLEKR